MEAVIFRHEFCMTLLHPMFRSRPLKVAILCYAGRIRDASLRSK
jgi:hypothetical protein